MANTKPSKSKNKSAILNVKVLYAIVFGFSFAIYANSIWNDYNLDDELVTRNHRLTKDGISAIPQIFKEPYYKDVSGYAYEYRPVVLVTFAIENSIFGENVHVSHFLNVVFYSALCVLLFHLLVSLLTGYSIIFPLLITLLFAAHPIHTEVVASIKNRDEILALSGALLSALFALKFIDSKKIIWPFLVPLFFAVGLLSKQTANVFLIFIPVALVVFRRPVFKKILLLFLLLASVAFPIMNISTISGKLTIIFAAFAFISFIHLFINSILSPAQLKKGFSEFSSGIKTNFITKPQAQATNEIWNIDGSLFSQVGFYFQSLLPAILFFVLGLLGIYFQKTVLTYAAVGLLSLQFYFSKPSGKFVALPALFTLVMAFVLLCRIPPKFFCFSFIVFLPVVYFNVSKLFKYSICVLFAALLLLCFYFRFFWALPVVLVIAGFYTRQLKPLTYIGVATLAGGLIFMLYKVISAKQVNYVFWFQIFPFSCLTLFTQFKKINLQRSVLIFLVFIGISFAMSWNYIGYRVNPSEITNNLIRLDHANLITINPKSVNRPLVFIEIPVSKTDPLNVQIGTASDILLKYLKLIIIPYPMAYYYGYSYITAKSMTDFTALLGLFLYAVLFSLSLFFLRKDKPSGFGILFFVVCICAYTNLVIPVPGMMADRFLFIPSLGFAFVFVALAFRFFKMDFKNVTLQNLPSGFKYSLTGILVIYSIMTVARNMDWTDDVTLFRHDISHVENSAQAQNQLALHLYLKAKDEKDQVVQKQMLEEAVTHFKRALEIYPQLLNASFDLGRTYEALGKSEEALSQYQYTVTLDTTFYSPYFNMALIQHNKGNLAAAIPLYEKFLIKFPFQPEVYANLSFVYYQLKQFDKSIETNRRMLVVKPQSFEAMRNLALNYLQMGQNDSARYYFEQALRINPNDAVSIKMSSELNSH